MKISDVVLAAGLFLLGLFYLYQSFLLPQGLSDGVPRSGSFPIYVATLLVAASILYFAQAVTSAEWHSGARAAGPYGKPHVLVMLVAILAYVGALDLVGFLISTIVFTTLALRGYFGTSWLEAVAAGLLTTFVTWAVFVYALGIPLPGGALFEQG